VELLSEDDADTDVGGDTPMIVPDLDPATTTTPHLVVFGSKQGTAYLVDRDNPPGGLIQRQACNRIDPTIDGSLLNPNLSQPPFGTIAPLVVFGPYSETYTGTNWARANHSRLLPGGRWNELRLHVRRYQGLRKLYQPRAARIGQASNRGLPRIAGVSLDRLR
jgi:hypothetical protein